ncbi:MAG: hypothetical protein RIC30_12745 [Marinoscillum sp.]|uniref:hypothetical protein n=1 Tax=Marinoscillum sp. TaxID=2024838 RepID=UPI0032FDE23C
MKYIFTFLSSVLFLIAVSAQEVETSYANIPDYPAEFTAETVAARMVDGLGFRYYWATDGLRAEDLSFRPNEEARSTRETLEHIFGLTLILVNSTRMIAHSPEDVTTLSFEELRTRTLENIAEASQNLKGEKANLEDFPVIFQRGEEQTIFPFWNQINGPIADALWHVGQVVSFRRTSGNPLNPNVRVFTGTVGE